MEIKMEMRILYKKTLIVMLLVVFGAAALPAIAQTCYGNVTATAPDSRYTDNRDGTVTDHRTKLM